MGDSFGRILIFGGTTEGRETAERLLGEGIPCTVSVATGYGEEVLTPHPLMRVRTGRLDRKAMAQMMREESFLCVIDATHPHALIVSQEIEAACRQTSLPYLRLMRKDLGGGDAAAERSGAAAKAGEASGTETDPSEAPEIVYVRDVEEAGAFLSSVPGRILVTTGSKELARFSEALGDPSRITARVLPSPESLQACAEAGLIGKQVFAMQGPFDTDMNCALIRHAGADWILTKETGVAGGYPEKIEAARICGTGAVVIRAYASLEGGERAADSSAAAAQIYDPEQAVAAAMRYAGAGGCSGCGKGTGAEATGTEGTDTEERRGKEAEGSAPGKRTLFLIGTGVGAAEAVTAQAREAVAQAEVLFGARSVLESAKRAIPEAGGKKAVPEYDSGAILAYLGENPQIGCAAVLYSGDSGFYSGAASMLEKLRGGGAAASKAPGEGSLATAGCAEDCQGGPGDLQVRVICGISSVSWFAARTGMPWQDWKILSSHGRFCNVVGQVRRNRKCFLLLSGAEDLRRTGADLANAQARGVLGDLKLIYGYELSRPAERICASSAQELTRITEEGLYVLYIEHAAAAKTPLLPGLPDSAFVRGKAPMTSAEIRALSLCRLGLSREAVLWDVGAGTGSVSVEAALTCPDGRVWSVEYKEEALALLTENRSKYCLHNMEIVPGRAPEALTDLPAPTHVFVGGSGGEIGRILELVSGKNPAAKVVVNCITSETLAALQEALKRLPVRDLQCVQVCVNREEKLGQYHYLRAGNPVFIISFQFSGKQ